MYERRRRVAVGGSMPRYIDAREVDRTTDTVQWRQLSAACARGDRGAMLRFARWFEGLSADPKDDFQQAANFWEYRYHVLTGDGDAWRDAWFDAHPEADTLRVFIAPDLCGAYNGTSLRFAGFAGWHDFTIHEIHAVEAGIIAVDALVREDRDEGGFGWESEYDRVLCDENLQPFPGQRGFYVDNDGVYDTRGYLAALERARALLEQRAAPTPCVGKQPRARARRQAEALRSRKR